MTTTFPQTCAAVRHITQHTPVALTRTRAVLLSQQLTTCTTAPPPGMLRQIVIAVRDLAGSAWLASHASEPAISAFTALDTMPAPPPVPILDHILAHCLQPASAPPPP